MSDTPFVPQNDPAPQEEFSVKRLIGIGLIIRVVVDSSIQLFFPFLPFIAQGLRVSEVRLGRLLSLRAVMGMLAPVFGALADRYGYRLVMTCLLGIASTGMFLLGSSQTFAMAAVGMTFAGIGLMSFPPILSAYMSAQLPFEGRSRGLGTLEYAWALAGIVGLSLLGQLIDLTSWRAPFFVLGVGMILGAVRIWFLPPAQADQNVAMQQEETRTLGARLYSFFDLGENWRSAVSVMLSGYLIMMAGMTFLINYGSWFAQSYGLEAADLGRIAFILGFADIVGSGVVSFVGDRLGKRNTVLVAALIGIVMFALLPWFDTNYVMAVTGAFLARFAFEMGIVGNMVLTSEQAPLQRGKVMTLSAAIVTLSIATAGITGPLIFARFGVAGLGAVGVCSMALAAINLFFFAKESA